MARSAYLLIVAAAAIASPVFGQSPPAKVGRSNEAFEVHYLKNKQAEFAASERAVAARNRGAESTAIYNLLKDKGPLNAANVVGRSAQEKEQVRDALVRTVAYFLTSLGLSPDDIRRMERDGLDPLKAGTNVLVGQWSLEDALTISPKAAVAAVASNQAGSDLADRQVAFTVERSLKGGSTGTVTLRVRLPSAVAQVSQGERYLLFLSDELGAFQQAAGRRSDGSPSLVALPFRLVGDLYEPTDPAQSPTSRNVAQIDQFVAQHATAFGAR